jgi:hypothetical protein
MSRWKIPLPKEKPQENQSNVAMALMTDKGTRLEFHGKVNAEAAQTALRMLVANMVKRDEAQLEQKG